MGARTISRRQPRGQGTPPCCVAGDSGMLRSEADVRHAHSHDRVEKRLRGHARPARAPDARGLPRLPRLPGGGARHQGHGDPRRAGDRRRGGHGHRARRAHAAAERYAARLRTTVPGIRLHPPHRGEPLLGHPAHAPGLRAQPSPLPRHAAHVARARGAGDPRRGCRCEPRPRRARRAAPRGRRHRAHALQRRGAGDGRSWDGTGDRAGGHRGGQAYPGDRLRDAALPPGRASHGLGAQEGPHPGDAHHRQHGGPPDAARARELRDRRHRPHRRQRRRRQQDRHLSSGRAGAPTRDPVLRRGTHLVDRPRLPARRRTCSAGRSRRAASAS